MIHTIFPLKVRALLVLCVLMAVGCKQQPQPARAPTIPAGSALSRVESTIASEEVIPGIPLSTSDIRETETATISDSINSESSMMQTFSEVTVTMTTETPVPIGTASFEHNLTPSRLPAEDLSEQVNADFTAPVSTALSEQSPTPQPVSTEEISGKLNVDRPEPVSTVPFEQDLTPPPLPTDDMSEDVNMENGPPDLTDEIQIIAVELSREQIVVNGTSNLSNDVCIHTRLSVDEQVVAWWPEDTCVETSGADWWLSFALDGENMILLETRYLLEVWAAGDPPIFGQPFSLDLSGPPLP